MLRSGESEEQKLITCNRCGKLTYEGFGSCQHCGAPLSGRIGSGVGPKTGAPEKPELPAWLESLRNGERPAESASEQFNHTSNVPVDKDALPSWMRPESAEHISADQYAVRRPASLPAPNTDVVFAGGIAANSLIDEQSLPSWMRENQSGADLSTQRNISAASLVQLDAPPEWMRTVQQPASPAASAPSTPMQYTASAIPPQGIAANSLVDPQVMPTWVSGQSGSNQLPPTDGNLAAASLLDMSALPKWLRENGQEQKPVRVEINPPARSGQVGGTNAAVAAPSLIDVNALPDWLRAGAEQGRDGAPSAASAPRTFNVSPRVENVRVPSRPRGEMGPREQSEAAANVFASVLGVASPVPKFPPKITRNLAGYLPSQGQPQMGGIELSGGAGPAPTPGYAAGSGGYQGYQGGYSILGVQQPGVPQQQPAMTANRQMESNSKTVKRGFLETIRGWFSH
jgi:ribosomal protein L37E